MGVDIGLMQKKTGIPIQIFFGFFTYLGIYHAARAGVKLNPSVPFCLQCILC